MKAVKIVSITCSLVVILAVGGFGIYEWTTEGIISPTTLFFVFIGIAFLFQSLTWGEMEGKHEAEKDEVEKRITLLSSKISYYVLLGLMVLVLIVSEKVTSLNDIKNLPLVLVIGLACITMPITEFVVSKRVR
ncbi:hypothetical protein [Falsibacillus albus]|uniref:DUF2178 domain-containing protein n=1 Tax=Falsibacillus albus TaxID=2478915 RepID=A0A3L7JQK8_9BACI|nr:hypothetical protein [Falsibacillus albus]RLQ93108.1 hypothetical protein D9X91_18940 [Falsibacillus albus]